MSGNAIVYRNEDSYCGPISMLVKLPDEDMLLTFREAKWRGRTTHSDPTARTHLVQSHDRGKTWRDAVCVTDDGRLLDVHHWLGEDGIRHRQRTSWELMG